MTGRIPTHERRSEAAAESFDQKSFSRFSRQLQNWLLAACAVAGVGILLQDDQRALRFSAVAVIAAFILVSRALLRYGAPVATKFLVTLFWLVNGAYIFWFAGVHSVQIIIYPFLALMCGWILGRTWLLGLTGLTVVFVLGLGYAEHIGVYTPTPRAGPMLVSTIEASVFVIMAILSLTILRAHSDSEERLKDEKRKLEKSQEELLRLLHFDPLTGLRSRYALDEDVRRLLQAQGPFALFTVVLKSVGLINHNFGPSAGSEAIAGAARNIAASLPAACTAYRLSGSQLGVLYPGQHDSESLEALARSLHVAMKRSLAVQKVDIYIDLAIGVACYPDDGEDAESLFRNAMIAGARAEQMENLNLSVYTPDLRDRGARLHWLDINLRRAIDANQFRLVYQPKVQMASGEVHAFEALLRWRHPEQGEVSPAEFVPRCETNGLIVSLGRWVIQQAAQQLSVWIAAGRTVRVSINVSAKQLTDPGLLECLREAQGIAGGHLDIELTESFLSESEGRLEAFLFQCRDLGFGIHLDDFGTGYSSFSRLAAMPLTALKIDRSFVSRIGGDPRNAAVLRSIVGVAHDLRLDLIAEGAETAEQIEYLKKLDVQQAQGWFYSKALEVEEAGRLLGTQHFSPHGGAQINR